jgi:hypothetical protein
MTLFQKYNMKIEKFNNFNNDLSILIDIFECEIYDDFDIKSIKWWDNDQDSGFFRENGIIRDLNNKGPKESLTIEMRDETTKILNFISKYISEIDPKYSTEIKYLEKDQIETNDFCQRISNLSSYEVNKVYFRHTRGGYIPEPGSVLGFELLLNKQ